MSKLDRSILFFIAGLFGTIFSFGFMSLSSYFDDVLAITGIISAFMGFVGLICMAVYSKIFEK